MSWLWLTIAAILSRSAYGVASKVMSSRIDAGAQTISVILLALAGAIGVATSPLFGGISFNGIGSHWLEITVMIASISIGNSLYYFGIAHLESSVTQIAFSSIVAWGAVLSVVFLHSHFSPLQLLGACVLAGAIWLAQFDRAMKANRAVFIIIASSALFAAFQVSSARVANVITPATYLVLCYLVPAAITFVAYFNRIRREMRTLRSQPSVILRGALPASITTMAYFLFTFYALSNAPDPGVVVLLVSTQVVVGVLLSAMVLKERKRLGRKVVAGVIAVIAGAMIRP